MNERSTGMLRAAAVVAVVVLLSACITSRARERLDPELPRQRCGRSQNRPP
jgi:hypothetical protein